MLVLAFCVVLLFDACAARIVSCNASVFKVGANAWSDPTIWSGAQVPASGDEVVCDISSSCGAFIGPFGASCLECSSCGCTNYAWSSQSSNPPYLLIDVLTATLTSFSASSTAFVQNSKGSLKTSVVIANGASLNATQITFSQDALVFLSGPNASIIASQQLILFDGRIGGTGTVYAPVTYAKSTASINDPAGGSYPNARSLVIPGQSKPGSVHCQGGSACSLVWPGVSVGASVFGDLIFEGDLQVTGNAAIFVKYGGTQPAARFYTGDLVDHVVVRGTLTFNSSDSINNVLVHLDSTSSYSNLDGKPPSITWTSINSITPITILVANTTSIRNRQYPVDPYPYWAQECFGYGSKCFSCTDSAGTVIGASSCATSSTTSLSVLVSSGTTSCSEITAKGCSPACLNGGTCVQTLFFCSCVSPWQGSDCGTHVTDCTNGCSGHGTCDALSGSSICDCITSRNLTYYGENCSSSVTQGCAPDCKGSCSADNSTCLCSSSTRGSSCQIPVCPGYNASTSTPNCGGYGSCQSGVCNCYNGSQPTASGSCAPSFSSTTSAGGGGLSTTDIILIAVIPGSVLLIAGFVVLLIFLRKREIEKRQSLFMQKKLKGMVD